MRFLILLLTLFCASGGLGLDLNSLYEYLSNETSSSNADCDVQKAAFLQGLLNGDTWTLKMLDASGRIPQAITQGNKVDLGSYDQCINIQEELETGTIKGRYCYSGLVIPTTLSSDDLSPVSSTEVIKNHALKLTEQRASVSDDILSLAVCIPDACSPSEVFGLLGLDLSCTTKDEGRSLDAGVIAFLTFIAVVTIIIIISTSYDVYLRRHQKESAHEILLAFSFYTNGQKIMKTTKREGQIPYFNGLKVISMFWVILGHRYASSEAFVSNEEEVKHWRRSWYSVYVLLAPLAVDTFLFISGALLSYAFLKTMLKPDRPKFNVFLFYLHRYLRITPALAMLYFAQMTIVPNVAPGPMSKVMFELAVNPPCAENWWSFFLYIQNYVATDNMCLLHAWYLSLDMQLFVVSPLILLPMVYFGKKVSYVAIPSLVVVTIGYTMLIFYFNDISMWSDDYYNLFYYVTHTRTSPWLIGLTFGAFILDYQTNKQNYQIKSQLLLFAIWGLAIAVLGVLFFSQDDVDNNHTTLKSTMYFPLQRPVWALFLCWLCYACMSGNAGFLNSFLSASIFQVLAKITYSTYLVHVPLLFIQMGAMRTIPYFTDYEALRSVLADICVSFAVGTIWTLAFESPIITIEKVIFGIGRKQEIVNKNVNNNVDRVGNNGMAKATV